MYYHLIALVAVATVAASGCGKKSSSDAKAEIEANRAGATAVIQQLRAVGKALVDKPPAPSATPPAGVSPSCNVLGTANADKLNDLFLYREDFADLTKQADIPLRLFGTETIRKAIALLEEGVLVGGTARTPVTSKMEDYEVDAIRYNLNGVAAFRYVAVVDRVVWQPPTKAGNQTFNPGKITERAVLYDLATAKALDSFEATAESSDGVTVKAGTGRDEIDADLEQRTRAALEAACKARYGGR